MGTDLVYHSTIVNGTSSTKDVFRFKSPCSGNKRARAREREEKEKEKDERGREEEDTRRDGHVSLVFPMYCPPCTVPRVLYTVHTVYTLYTLITAWGTAKTNGRAATTWATTGAGTTGAGTSNPSNPSSSASTLLVSIAVVSVVSVVSEVASAFQPLKEMVQCVKVSGDVRLQCGDYMYVLVSTYFALEYSVLDK